MLDFSRLFLKFQSIFVLLLIPILYKYGLSNFAFAIYDALCLIFLANKCATKFKVDKKMLLASSAYLLWLIVEFFSFGFQGITRIVQFTTIICIIIVNSKIEWRKSDFIFLKRCCQISLLTIIIWIPVGGFNVSRYAAYFSHSNYLGSITLYLFVLLNLVQYAVYGKKNLEFVITECIVLFFSFASGSRSSLLAILLFKFLVILIGYKYSKGKNVTSISQIVVIATIVFAAVFTIIYPLLVGTNFGNILELASRHYLNKNFFSGREVLWKEIIDMIKESPIWGYGLDAMPKRYFDTTFSSHNCWLQTVLQVGLVGFTILLLLFTRVVRLMIKNKYCRIGIPFFCAVIIHESFEVTLLQNEFATGMIAWMIFGIVISKRLSNR